MVWKNSVWLATMTMAGCLLGAVSAQAQTVKIGIETADGRVITYANTFALAGRLANARVARGVTPSDRVAVQEEKSPGSVILYLAYLREGVVYLPLNTAYTLAEFYTTKPQLAEGRT